MLNLLTQTNRQVQHQHSSDQRLDRATGPLHSEQSSKWTRKRENQRLRTLSPIFALLRMVPPVHNLIISSRAVCQGKYQNNVGHKQLVPQATRQTTPSQAIFKLQLLYVQCAIFMFCFVTYSHHHTNDIVAAKSLTSYMYTLFETKKIIKERHQQKENFFPQMPSEIWATSGSSHKQKDWTEKDQKYVGNPTLNRMTHQILVAGRHDSVKLVRFGWREVDVEAQHVPLLVAITAAKVSHIALQPSKPVASLSHRCPLLRSKILGLINVRPSVTFYFKTVKVFRYASQKQTQTV